MIVVGGTYAEVVTDPGHRDDASGSGVRAAAALRHTARLATAVDALTADAATAAAAALGIERDVSDRDRPVGFRYFTPVSDPAIDGRGATYSSSLDADDASVLVFGMVEQGTRSVHAQKLVVDPQNPRDLVGLNTDGLRWDELAIVANTREAAALAPDSGDVPSTARAVLERYNAAVVVVKDSGRGCVVVTDQSSDTERVGPHPTLTVWPLASGDVFAAGFAHAWSSGADPIEAARVASSSAAWWCGTRQSAVPPEILSGQPVETILNSAAPELAIPERAPTIYLAGPFFTLANRWLVELCRDVLRGLGARVFSPLHDVGRGGDEVAAQDLAGLRDCDAVLALLDGWDPGTVYETGWAHHQGLPVIGFMNSPSDYATKMLVGTGAEIHKDLSSALYRAVWAGQGHVLVGARVPASE